MKDIELAHNLLIKIEDVLNKIVEEFEKKEIEISDIQNLYAKKGELISELENIKRLPEANHIPDQKRSDITGLYQNIKDLDEKALKMLRQSVDTIAERMQQNSKEIETSNAYNERLGRGNSVFINSKLEG